MSGLEWLIRLDRALLVLIHNDSDHQFLDGLSLLLRNALTWIPLYAGVLLFAIKKYQRKAILFVLLSLLTFAICDQLSANILKPFFHRPRPCFDDSIKAYMRNIIECGGRYSFPSSHATNHFGLAAFWYWAVKYTTGKKWSWLWFWAAAICYAQVYVAKHYVLDVASGALLGSMIGALIALLFRYLFSNLQTERTLQKLIPS